MDNLSESINLYGKIKSVYCENFVTYEICKLCPEKYLNIIIGPNGTGKSTLIAAIVLGLGGEPHLLNRCKSISDFVMNGKKESLICIEIHGKKNNLVTFTRKFNNANESQFIYNNKSVSKKQYLLEVEAFNIHVNNLCQFLPQDRVQDFLKMNSHELLENTLISICDSETIKNFHKLKELRKKYVNMCNSLKCDKERLDQIFLLLEQQKISLDEYNLQKELKGKIELYTAKLKWLEAKKIKREIIENEKDLDKALQNFKQKQNKCNHLALLMKDFDRNEKNLNKELEQKNHDIERMFNLQTKLENDFYSLNQHIQQNKRQLKSNKINYSEQQLIIKKESKLLETFLEDLKMSSEECDRSLEAKKKNENELFILNQKIETANHKHYEINKKLDDVLIAEVNVLKNKINRLENSTEQKLLTLSTQYPNLGKAVRWLQNNSQLFTQKVYNPMILEVNIVNTEYAKYFENTIRIKDLLAFTCSNSSDMSMLIMELCVKQKLGINVIWSQSANRNSNTPKYSINDIRHLGFEFFLVDMIKGPAPIINKLCDMYNIHNIPVGNDTVSNNLNKIPYDIKQFFGGHKRYKISCSKYCNEKILQESFIKGKNLLSSVDLNEIISLKMRLNELLQSTDPLKNQRTSLEVLINNLEHKKTTLQEIKRANEAKCLRKERLANEVKRYKSKVNLYLTNSSSIDKLTQSFELLVKDNAKKAYEMQKQKLELVSKLMIEINAQISITTKVQIYKSENFEMSKLLDEADQHQKQAKILVDKIKNSLESLQQKYKNKKLEVENNTNKHGSFEMEVANLSIAEWEHLKEKLSECQARLECMANINEEALKSYLVLTSKLEQLDCKIRQEQSNNQHLDDEIKAIYKNWAPKIFNIITAVSMKFGYFMSKICCVGEVILSKEDEFDFDSWGLKLMVQYHKDTPLQTLDKSLQSGGERSVATAIYTLSLQHISQVPFRCVDEINQGMDASNEKAILNMLLDETTKTSSSQYFFASPKIPRDGLNFNEKLNVIIVHNGYHIDRLNKFS